MIDKNHSNAHDNKDYSLIAKRDFAIIASNEKLVLNDQIRSEKEGTFSKNSFVLILSGTFRR